MKDDLVILHPDGGIASQIAFVALGLAFEQKGAKVKYDLSCLQRGLRDFGIQVMDMIKSMTSLGIFLKLFLHYILRLQMKKRLRDINQNT